ncbi:peptidase domain-containing ABC transporter [Diplocloster agilis]|uniref:peptidase domain-containing ABC transporter n=1 Tax=Diplocloster agilis TaxID=2850323 RepID=UPI0008230104|nr:peptidase domain-containing ABC transporter [Suonthocola fibrivorans]MCU6736811.1 peptidase domain-containing ABC transporter [Suonthocola fibrivorans]SCJ93782.1 Lactococcin-G-processing and transport ATP-binding protein LagD [uncultured Clostridium sp.]
MRYNFVKQLDSTDCAAACLAMICLYYKKETTVTKLRDLMGTDIKGTNLVGLSKAAKELGFVSQAVRVEEGGFFVPFTLPCIAHVMTKEGIYHFVVVFKKSKTEVVIGDPAKDLMRMPVTEFLEMFTGNMLLIKPAEGFSGGKEKGGRLWSRFLKLLLPQKKLFLFSILASFVITVLGIVSSLFNKILLDEILPYELEQSLVILVLIFITLQITMVIVGFIREWMMIYLSQKIDIPLILGYFQHVYKLPMKFFAARRTGDIITRFNDAFTIKNMFTNVALTLIMDITLALITGVILYFMNPELFFLIALLVLIELMLVVLFKEPYRRINEEQMQQVSVLNSQIIEGLQAVETIKGNATEDLELEQVEREYIKTLRMNKKENMLSNVQEHVSSLIISVGNLLLMYFGGKMVIRGGLTLGSLMAFGTLSVYFMDPINRLAKLQLQIQEASISMRRVAEIMDCDREQEDGYYQELKTVEGDICVNHITFRYGNRKPVLKDVSFHIEKGQKVAIVGSSGSGKSTIAKLLLKYYEPEEGDIRIDGMDLREIRVETLRKLVSYVPQQLSLFSRSVFDNIRVTKMDATREEVKAAAKKADAEGFINKLPLQYDTYLEEAGNGLSGGEKQRLALARAFLKDSNFYIMDEATSNLDFGAESLIFDMIYNKFKDKSMLIIAHRLATIKDCDQILVMDEGSIIEQGTHGELLEKRGRYYELWNMQQGIFKGAGADE